MSHSPLKSEPISKNPFFQILRQTYTELYSLAAKRGWKILVPHSSKLNCTTLNEYFFKSHILQSSPYFKEEFVTLNGQCIVYKDGKISTKTGFDSPTQVAVLGEELFYDDAFNAFSVYCIEAPLIRIHFHQSNDVMQSNHQNYKKKKTEHTPIELRTDKHWIKTLANQLPPNIYKKILVECQAFTEQFQTTYIMLKGYTQSASKRIENFRKNVFEQTIINPNEYKKNSVRLKLDANALDELQCSVDCYLNFILFDCIFMKFLVQHYKKEDAVFSGMCPPKHTAFLSKQGCDVFIYIDRLRSLRSLTQKQVGIKGQFQSKTNFESAVNALKSFNKHKTPINRLGVLKNTFKQIKDSIDEEKQNDLSPKSRFAKKDEMALTTEDFIALFAFVLIHSNVEHLLANHQYLSHFYFKNPATAHLEYFQASYEASIQYIKNHLFRRR